TDLATISLRRRPPRSRWTASPNAWARSSGSQRPNLVTTPRPAGVPLPVARKPHVLETRAARTTGYGDDWPLRAPNCCLALRPHDLPRPVLTAGRSSAETASVPNVEAFRGGPRCARLHGSWPRGSLGRRSA